MCAGEGPEIDPVGPIREINFFKFFQVFVLWVMPLIKFRYFNARTSEFPSLRNYSDTLLLLFSLWIINSAKKGLFF